MSQGPTAFRSFSSALICLALSVSACGHLSTLTTRLDRQLISEPEAVRLGHQAAEDLLSETGLYDERPALSKYIQSLGERLAQNSERPNLQWRFRVLDSPTLNAFALPSGDILISRGLIAHLSNEAQLAAVLSHEIAHITAYHGISKLARKRVTDASNTFISAINARAGDLSQRAATLLLLFHSRLDEVEADERSLKYFSKQGYDPNAVRSLFLVLQDPAPSKIPAWRRTHPRSEARAKRLEKHLAKLPPGTLGEAVYLTAIDGMLFGHDPRRGTLQDGRFIHAQKDYQIQMPQGWSLKQESGTALAFNLNLGATITLAPSTAPDIETASQTYFDGDALVRGTQTAEEVSGLKARSIDFHIAQDVPMNGRVTFISHPSGVLIFSAQSTAYFWPATKRAALKALMSLNTATEQIAMIRPKRLKLSKLSAPSSIDALHQDHPHIELNALARLNQAAPKARLNAGRTIKLVAH